MSIERRGKHTMRETRQPYYLIEGNLREIFDDPKPRKKTLLERAKTIFERKKL